MSILNYILTFVSFVAIAYSYSVGSVTGIVIWVIVLGLNIALLLIQWRKTRQH